MKRDVVIGVGARRDDGDDLAVALPLGLGDRRGDEVMVFLAEAVAKIGAVLAPILPPTLDNPNELPDRLIVL